jgi:O-antigen/teichoic acid export membrane protein
MRFVRRALSKAGGFGLSVVVTGVVSLTTIPFVIVHGGETGWAAVAVGQSIGALIGIFTMLGWLQSGPTEVARSVTSERWGIYARSLQVRSLSLALTLPAAFFASHIIVPSSGLVASLAASSVIVMNLGASWFFVGESSPGSLFILDTLPRAAGIVIATICIAFGGGLIAYVALVLLGNSLGAAVSAVSISRRYRRERVPIMSSREVLVLLRGQRHGIASAMLSAIYLSAPLLFVQTLAPAAVPAYALADKVKQQAFTALRPVSQVLQGWTPSGGERDVVRRTGMAWMAALALGVLTGGVVALAGPAVALVLGSGVIAVPHAITIPMGIALGMQAISLTTGVAGLVVLRLEKHITISALVGTLLVLSLLVPAIAAGAGVGAAWAVAASQTAVAVYQSVVLLRERKRRAP